MRESFRIDDAKANVVFDSRGSETVEVELWSGSVSTRVSAPSGKSRGSREVVPFPDNDARKSVDLFNKIVKGRLVGFDPADQTGVDDMLKQLDGTGNFSKIGGNLAYAVSACAAVLTARLKKLPPWKHISELSGLTPTIPLPLGNILGGGSHAGSGAPDVQEYLVFPLNPSSVEEAVKTNIEAHRRLGVLLTSKLPGYGGGRGDEGGYSPPVDDLTAMQHVHEACKNLAVGFGLDVAASSLYDKTTGHYVYRNRGVRRNREEQLEFVSELVERFNIKYLEDPFDESDFDSFSEIVSRHPNILVCGDDLVVTRYELIREAARRRAVKAVILKPNQVGTLSDTVKAAVEAEKNGIVRVVSHRSGETCDSFLSHLAVGLGGKFIKAGVVGGERVAKANELIRIWRESGASLPLQRWV